MPPRDGTRRRPRRREVTSCEHCLAWGMTHSQGLCLDCYNFLAPRFGRHEGVCAACGLARPLKRGYCRSCWCQARLERTWQATNARSAVVLAPYLPGIRRHQLFLAGHSRRTAEPRRIERRRGAKGRPPKRPPARTPAPAPPWLQPPLFDADGRDFLARRIDLRTGPAPDNPYLAHALHLAHRTGELRGWSPAALRNLQRILVPLLAAHLPGETIQASDVRALCRRYYFNLESVLELLADLDIVDDDLPPALDGWLRRTTHALPAVWASDILAWAHELRDGGPRSRPREPSTVYTYLSMLLPALTDWSTRHSHLREVTAADVHAFYEILHGSRRETTLTALRSLFTWARRSKRIFANPTRGLTAPKTPDRLWQPLPDHALAEAVAAVRTPQARLFLALTAVHGARPGQIRTQQLDDVDLPGAQLTIAGVTRPLDDFTRTVLIRWLDHRRARWPRTANRHLLITKESALGLRPVSHAFVLDLRPTEVTFEQLRIDRRLAEALATGGDPAMFLAVFGGSEHTATRYAANARALLQDPQDPTPASESGTPGPKPDNPRTAPPSSP